MAYSELIAQRDALAAQQAEITRQIQAQAAEDKARSLQLVRDTMHQHGITLADLQGKADKPAAKKARKAGATRAVGVTYAFPDGARYTTGKIGKPPGAYLRAKLAGTLEQFKVAA